MDKKIFSLPTMMLSLFLASVGYYWGMAFQQAKVLDVRLDKVKQGANGVKNPSPAAKTEIASPAATSAPPVPAANKAVRSNTTAPSVSINAKKIVKPASAPIATQPVKTPASTVPAAQPAAAPSVQAPNQQPAPAPAPTTKVS